MISLFTGEWKVRALILLVAGGILVSCSGVKSINTGQYPPSSKIKSRDLSSESWQGMHVLPGVYCVKFPDAEKAVKISERSNSNNSIHLVRVTYPYNIAINIVTSTIPLGRTADEEIERLYALEELGENSYEHNYNISKSYGMFGPVIGIRINDVAPFGKDAVFPLVRPLYKSNGKGIKSMSAHRLFVRGSFRFEIAVLQLAPMKVNEFTEKHMNAQVTGLAEVTLDSFEQCTSQLPVRIMR